MRILTFTSLFPNNAFPTKCVFTKERIGPLATRNGCQVKVVAPVPYFPDIRVSDWWRFSQVSPKETIDGIDVYHPRYFMTPKIGMASYGYLMYLFSLPVIRKIREEFDFDIIDTHFTYPDGFAGILLGRYFGKPVVVTSHGTDLNLYPAYPVIRQFLRYTLGKADRVVAVCNALRDVMIRLDVPGGKISVIPNAIDLKKFYPMAKEDARRTLGITSKHVVVSVGSLIPIKGHDVLIRAVKLLVEELGRGDLSLNIVGEGPYRRTLEKLVSSLKLEGHVRFVGAVPHSDMILWFNAADISCLASSREGWPCVLLESLACGTPVVATNVWGIPEVIRNDRIGLLAERNPRDFADKIHAALRKSWDFRGIVEYANDFTWERAAGEIHKVYSSITRFGEEHSASREKGK
jgi:glycosyltransferase involved in cell wall biosynthesis